MKYLATLLFIISFCFIKAQTLPQYVSANGLVGWWPFSGNANDESDNGFDGVVNGANLTTDRFGNLNSAYSFDGVDDLISMSGITNDYDSYSISCWILTNSIPTGIGKYKGVLGKGSWGENHGGDHTFFLVLQDRHYEPTEQGVLIGYENFSGTNMVLNHSDISDFSGNWKHLVVSYDHLEETLSIYVNAELVESTSTTIGLNINTEPLIVGNMYTPPMTFQGMQDAFFDGKIDDIGIWDRVLVRDEITNLYNSSLSIEKIESNNSFIIYPNPAITEIKVLIDGYHTPITYSIYDQLGKVVRSGKLESELSTIDISDFSQGTYMFIANDNKESLIRLIKQ